MSPDGLDIENRTLNGQYAPYFHQHPCQHLCRHVGSPLACITKYVVFCSTSWAKRRSGPVGLTQLLLGLLTLKAEGGREPRLVHRGQDEGKRLCCPCWCYRVARLHHSPSSASQPFFFFCVWTRLKPKRTSCNLFPHSSSNVAHITRLSPFSFATLTKEEPLFFCCLLCVLSLHVQRKGGFIFLLPSSVRIVLVTRGGEED